MDPNGRAHGNAYAPFLPGKIRFGWPLAALRRLRRGLAALTLGAVALTGCHTAAAHAGSMPNLALPTAGGQQMWADVAWDDGWRVQEHVWTGHARLLDGGDVRRAWGSTEACLAGLEQRRARGEAATPGTRTAVVLHGLWRTRDAMAPIVLALEEEGYEVIDIAYPSTRRNIADHANQVAGLLDRLPGDEREISFVTHSLGGLVVRSLFDREGDAWRNKHELGRAVMIAAPNQGAEIAELAERIPLALTIYGKPSQELSNGAAKDLGVPPLPVLTVAGARDGDGGWNPFIDGPDDGVVAESETHLEGEAGSLTVPALHTFIMSHPDVIAATIEFLKPKDSTPR